MRRNSCDGLLCCVQGLLDAGRGDRLSTRKRFLPLMDAPYTALARRFRPQTFTEVVGQGRIATTLRNAILEGRVAHAYLFTGARGVGKTSMARIFAKALNCPQAKDAVPCNECEICRSIAAGQDVDVSEIDGASNRGIDDIRALRANVNVRSMRSRYKVYIVDEVHMLTKEAFNALLKTLEEPPPGVKFVFCTTEPNKVPDTILSRCQRFDFGTIATEEIRGRLSQLADAEGFQVDNEALELVARRAAGSMRDSQSLFDQLLAFGSQQISADDVHRLLGTAPDERLIDMVSALIERQPADALSQLDEALSQGVQLDPFWDQLLAYTRDLMVTASGATTLPLLSVGERQRARVVEQAQVWGLQTVLAALEIAADTKQKMQRTTFGRALAELALVRIAQLRDLEQLSVLIAELKSGGSGSPGGRPDLTAAPQLRSTPRLTTPGSASVPTTSPVQDPEKKNDAALTAHAALTARGDRHIERPAPESGQSDSRGPGDDVESPRSSAETGATEAATTSAVAIPWGPECSGKVLLALQERFPDIIGTYLKHVVSTAIIGPNQLEFSFPVRYDIHRRACERSEVLSRLEAAATELTGVPVRLRFGVSQQEAAPPQRSEVKAPAARSRTVEDPTDPLVAEVGRVFGVESWSVQNFGPVAVPIDEDDATGDDATDAEVPADEEE